MYWRLPEAGALRKHLGTRARLELSAMQRDLQRCKLVLGNIGRYARHIAAYAKLQGWEQQDTFARSFVQQHIQDRSRSMVPQMRCCVCQSRLCLIEYPGAEDASPTSLAEEGEDGREDDGDDDGEQVAMDASATSPVEQR